MVSLYALKFKHGRVCLLCPVGGLGGIGMGLGPGGQPINANRLSGGGGMGSMGPGGHSLILFTVLMTNYSNALQLCFKMPKIAHVNSL